MARARIETELGREIQCTKCGEFWPDDTEFFYQCNGRSHSWCKACYRNDEKVIAKNQRGVERLKEKRASLKHSKEVNHACQ